MSIAVFWLDADGKPQVELLAVGDLLGALKLTEAKRKEGLRHVVLSSENPDSVGQKGVSDKLPEGYDWTKRRTTALRKDQES